MSAFNTPKTTALAPMASVSVKTAVIVKPGDLHSWRRANRRSCSRVVMVGLRVTVGLYGKKGNSRVEFEDFTDVGDAEFLAVEVVHQNCFRRIQVSHRACGNCLGNECESVSHAFSFRLSDSETECPAIAEEEPPESRRCAVAPLNAKRGD